MVAAACLAAYLGATEPLSLESIRAIRAGAKRINDYPLLTLADAALRDLACQSALTGDYLEDHPR